MRRQINGLAVAVEQEMNGDPFSHALFLFCNRERRIIKALYWDATGFAMWQKRLEIDKFQWPSTAEQARAISGEQMEWLLAGFNIEQAHRYRRYAI